jgi:type IV secretory pathway TraG/TraD family ATPase VirD4
MNPEITYFAKTNFRNERKLFGIKQSDRAYHTYIIGKTGAGKTNLLKTKILQDIQFNRGLCLFDIHGDLIEEIQHHLPLRRKGDVVFLNIPDKELSIGYNPLKRVSFEKRSLVASSILESFERLNDSKSWGAKLSHILRFILLTLLDQKEANFSDILRIMRDKEYRKSCLKNVINPDVKDFWTKEFYQYTKFDLVPIYNKIGGFLAHPAIKRFLVENKNTISLRKIMDGKKILLVNLSKGAIGTDSAYLLGSLLLSSLTSASFSRIDTLEALRVPFHVYLDEFQNYTNPSLVNMLSELRKFKVTLTLAHQYLDQLEPDIRSAVLGNVGTIISFRLGAFDAQHMMNELFNEYQPIFTIGDYVNLPNYYIYLRLMIDGKPSKPFSAITIQYKNISDNFLPL